MTISSVLSSLSVWLFLSTSAIVFPPPAAGQPKVTCENASDACARNSSCNAVLQEYISACQAVISSGNAADCSVSSNCVSKLNVANEHQPLFRTCTCSTATCLNQQMNLVKGCFGLEKELTCSDHIVLCNNESNCNQAYARLLINCGGQQQCTHFCVASERALFSTYSHLRNCKCNPDNANCKQFLTFLHKCIDDNPSAKPVSLTCENMHQHCEDNATCSKIFHRYVNSCTKVFASGSSSDCTTECITNLREAVSALPNLNKCQCGNAECRESQANFEKGCFSTVAATPTPTSAAKFVNLTLLPFFALSVLLWL